MTSDREIEIRFSILRYFLEKKTNRSWEDFDRSWNIYNINKSEYTQFYPIFENADLRNVKIPKIVKKILSLVDEKNKGDYSPSLENQKTIIDGFEISTNKVFNITVSYIRKRFDEFNKKYFGNQLDPSGIHFDLMNHFQAYGVTVSRRDTHEVAAFAISDTAGKTERTYCATIIHEMIHVYQIQVLKRIPEGNSESHNDDFKAKMNEINSRSKNAEFPNGWNVATNVTEDEIRGEVFDKSSKICNILERYYNFIYFDPSDIGFPVGAGFFLNNAVRVRKDNVCKSFRIENGLSLCKYHLEIIDSPDQLSDLYGALTLIPTDDVNKMATRGDIVLNDSSMREEKLVLNKKAVERIIESKMEDVKNNFDINNVDPDSLIKTQDPYHSIYIDDNGKIFDCIF